MGSTTTISFRRKNMSNRTKILIVVIPITLLIIAVGVSYCFWLSDQTKNETTTFLTTFNSDQSVTMSPKFQTTVTSETDLPTPLTSDRQFSTEQLSYDPIR